MTLFRSAPLALFLATPIVGCGPSDACLGECEGGGSGSGSSSASNTDGDDGQGESGGNAAACAALEQPMALGNVHKQAADDSGCMLGYQVIGGDTLNVLSLHTGDVHTLSTALSRTLPWSWRFVPGSETVIYREDGVLLAWDEASGSRVLADPGADFVVGPSGQRVVYSEAGYIGFAPVWSQSLETGMRVELSPAGQIAAVDTMIDGTVGVLIEVDAGGDQTDLLWASIDGSRSEVLATDARLAGHHPPTGTVFFQRGINETATYGVVTPNTGAPATMLALDAPPHPGDATATGSFSPDGSRLLVRWNIFDFDTGYTDPRMDMVQMGVDPQIDVHPCPAAGSALGLGQERNFALDLGVICVDDGTIVGYWDTMPGAALDGPLASHLHRLGETTFVYDVLRPDLPAVDGAEATEIKLLDVENPQAPLVTSLGTSFLRDTVPDWRGVNVISNERPEDITHLLMSDRPYPGLVNVSTPVGWHSYELATGATIALDEAVGLGIPRLLVGTHAVTVLGPTLDDWTVAPLTAP